MQSKNTKNLDFSGENIYIGLDVHKKSWLVTIHAKEFEHKRFTIPPSPTILHKYLHNNFPGATYYSAYEAGFCGYSHHRSLNNLGINNIVINPADIPSSNKERNQSTDKIDSRKIARELKNGSLKPIYVFEREEEEFRSMARYRFQLIKDMRRCKNRIKGWLFYYGIDIPGKFDNNNWSHDFINWLKQIKMETTAGNISLQALINDYLYKHQQILDFVRQLRMLMKKQNNELYMLLRTIPGIGPLTSISLILEINQIERFKHIKNLSSFVGLTPYLKQSGENERSSGITYRCNPYLRSLLIEAAWVAVRKDPALMAYYKKHIKNSKPQKVIVKVARKLLNRVMYVMKNREPYILKIQE